MVKNNKILIRLTADEKAKIKQKAIDACLPLSQYCLHVLLTAEPRTYTFEDITIDE